MKILIPCSTIDLKYKLGCTPSWWQLIKAFHETGNEVIITPYLGDPVESLWWRTYPNPCSFESRLYNAFLNIKRNKCGLAGRLGNDESILNKFANTLVHDKWEEHILKILEREKDIDAILFMNIPINHIAGIAEKVRFEYGIPVAYFDGDMPTILPKYALGRGFKFNYYVNADLSEFDLFFSNSKGVIPDLKELGAKKVFPLYYAIDPDLFSPVACEKTIDVSFYGHGSEFREEWMEKMITFPSNKLTSLNFEIGGKGFSISLGHANIVGDLSYSAFRNFCCASKICLNITRWSHTNIYASSTARPFELAGFGACIVSQPYNGIEEWFTSKEISIVHSSEEAEAVYQQFIDEPDLALTFGERARQKVINEHNFNKRAQEVVAQLSGVC
jgi:hypothetical protein